MAMEQAIRESTSTDAGGMSGKDNPAMINRPRARLEIQQILQPISQEHHMAQGDRINGALQGQKIAPLHTETNMNSGEAIDNTSPLIMLKTLHLCTVT